MTRLALVNAETGELHDGECPMCAQLRDQLAGAERDLRGWAMRYAELKREKDQDAREHELWPVAKTLFDYWREACRHKASRWTVDRFWECQALLAKYGPAIAERAIAGAAFDPNTTLRRNGSTKRFDDWELIWRNAGKLEEFACRAPRDWKPTLELVA